MSEGYRVLVAEDEATYAMTVARFLKERGHDVKVCATGRATLKALADSEWEALLLDLKLPDASGIDILARVRKENAELQTIIVTGFANVESAIEAMRLGAFDYLTKPPKFEELAVRVERAAQKTLLERENARLRFQVGRGLADDIVTRSPALQKIIATLEKVAAAKAPVLIEGESGVGKELLAQHLHRTSPRATRAFVDLNCAAVPAALLESELFGHERGAFTGAASEKPGLVEVADGGTLFLDEVGRDGGRGAVEAPARPRHRNVLPRRRHAQAAGRLPPGRRHEPRPAGRGRGRALPEGPVLSRSTASASSCRLCASAPRTSRSSSSTSRGSARAGAASRPRPSRRWGPRLAGERAGAALRRGAGEPSGRGGPDRRGRSPARDRREGGPRSACRSRRPRRTSLGIAVGRRRAGRRPAGATRVRWGRDRPRRDRRGGPRPGACPRRPRAGEVAPREGRRDPRVSPRTLYRWIKKLDL